MQAIGDTIRVLHVDDEPGLAEATGEFLERADDRLTVKPVTSVRDGMEQLASDEFHCIVSDHDMPDQTGLEFFQTVRREYPNLPFILYTGKGSEEVASEAISVGVTDYLQKGGGTEQYELLANRIITAVEAYIAQQDADWQEMIIENMGEGVYVFDDTHTLQYVNFRVSDIETISEADWTGRHASYFAETGFLSPAEIDKITSGIDRILAEDVDEVTIEIAPSLPEDADVLSLRLTQVQTRTDENLVLATSRDITERKEREQHLHELKRQYETLAEHFPDGAVYLINQDLEYVRARGQGLREVGFSPDQIEGITPHDLFPPDIADETCARYRDAFDGESSTFEQTYQDNHYRIQVAPVQADDGSINRIIAVSQNITEAARQKQRRERQNERLTEFADVVSHDLRNPLNVAENRLHLAAEECNSEHLEHATRALGRMERLIDHLLKLARDGQSVGDVGPVVLDDLAETCWEAVETQSATLGIETELTIEADRERCQQLLENLIRNAVEHGGETVTVTVGTLDDRDGFYIADDGRGIDTDESDAVFESGYTTNDGGSGFGLAIVRRIAEAHGWTVTARESEQGGARFDITGVERVA